MKLYILLTFSIFVLGCQNKADNFIFELGMKEDELLKIIEKKNAKDITSLTNIELYQAISNPQKCYWIELQDKTIVGILLIKSKKTLNEKYYIKTIEASTPGAGINCIKNWRKNIVQSYGNKEKRTRK